MLSDRDSLKLNVLLAQSPGAIKINDSAMVLKALTSKGEARVELCANCKPQAYLKEVREFLSTHVLGSPGGYPIFLRRWTRMGQARSESLQRLLLLGEEEAVTAVVHAKGLTPEIAAAAWWVLPSAEHARKMMQNESIAKSEFGTELIEFLLEFLPFEEEPAAMIESIRLVLMARTLKNGQVKRLWAQASRKPSYYIGFLQSLADELPIEASAHPHYNDIAKAIEELDSTEHSSVLPLLSLVLSQSGQAYLKTIKLAFAKPNNQDVVVGLLNTLGSYFRTLNTENRAYRDLEMWNRDAIDLYQRLYSEQINGLSPPIQDMMISMVALSMVDETMVNPIFGVSDAIGSVMRKKIRPVFDEVLIHVDRLYSC